MSHIKAHKGRRVLIEDHPSISPEFRAELKQIREKTRREIAAYYSRKGHGQPRKSE